MINSQLPKVFQPGRTMVSAKLLDTRTVELTSKRNGKIVSVSRLSVGPRRELNSRGFREQGIREQERFRLRTGEVAVLNCRNVAVTLKTFMGFSDVLICYDDAPNMVFEPTAVTKMIRDNEASELVYTLELRAYSPWNPGVRSLWSTEVQ